GDTVFPPWLPAGENPQGPIVGTPSSGARLYYAFKFGPAELPSRIQALPLSPPVTNTSHVCHRQLAVRYPANHQVFLGDVHPISRLHSIDSPDSSHTNRFLQSGRSQLSSQS